MNSDNKYKEASDRQIPFRTQVTVSYQVLKYKMQFLAQWKLIPKCIMRIKKPKIKNWMHRSTIRPLQYVKYDKICFIHCH